MTAAWEIAPEGRAAEITAGLAAGVPEIETERLRLRAPLIGDFAAYAEILCSDRAVHIGGPMSREAAFRDFAEAVAGWMLRGHGLWSVERRGDGALLGFLPLHIEAGDPEREVGYMLCEAAEGNGYAAEAARAARDFAYGTLGWRGVVSYVDPANTRSIATAERLGATPDPTARHPLDPDLMIFRHPAPRRPLP
jgi:RimJ/RimL family protein N-acetyltransferase